MEKQLNYKSEILIYGLAVGINRGALLIFMPFITSMLGIIAYGDFNFVQVIMQLLSPFLVFNISAAVMREGAEDPTKGSFLAYHYVLKIIRNTALLFIVGLILSTFYKDGWLYIYAILLAGIEGLHNIMLSLIRTKNKHLDYIIFTLLKTFGFIVLFLLISRFISISLKQLLLLQVSTNILIYIYYYFKYREKEQRFEPAPRYLQEIIHFSLLLLPHGLAQWFMSASNRIILKYMDSDYNLGIFSISFTLAMVGMVINSGIGIVLPQQIIRDYDSWITKKKLREFSLLYTLAFLLTMVALLTAVKIDMQYYHVLKSYDKNTLFQFLVIFSGFYLLGYYYYYSNILFYFKQAKVISRVTVISSAFSVITTLFLTYFFSTTGTAVSMLLSYAFYATFIALESFRYEKVLKKSFPEVLGMQFATIILFYLILKLFSFQ